MWSANQYLEDLYKESLGKHTKEFDRNWQISLRNRFQKLLGNFEDNKDSLNPILLEKIDMGSYYRKRVEITTVGQMKMPVYVLTPKSGKRGKFPAVLAIHGHGYGNKGVVGLNADGSIKNEEEYHKDFAISLVNKGMVVVVPELIGFGERKLEEDQGKQTDNSCYMIASQLLLFGKTLAGLRVKECRRVIDYIHLIDEVDNTNVGCMGISGGGLVAGFTSVLDERIKATVISGYTNTFKGSIMDRRHCLDNYIPEILEHAEMPELIGLIVPRPLFIEAGKDDHLFPLDKVKFALKKLSNIYDCFAAKDVLKLHVFDGGHEISGEESFDWLKMMLSISLKR